MKSFKAGFTLIELMVVIAIIGILSSVVFFSARRALTQARFVRSESEVAAIAKAMELYMSDHDYQYPPDQNRGLPNGFEHYLSSAPSWPSPPFPNSEYDWDNWAPNGLSYDPKQQVYQISIRFCPFGQPENCNFPNYSWATNFDYYSGVYYCIEGPCRAHSSMPVDHPACCIGGSCPASAVKCGAF